MPKWALGRAEPEASREVPVVFVHGVLGAKLRRVETQRVLWGKFGNMVGPRDGGYNLVLPITLPNDAEPEVEAFHIFNQVRVVALRRVVYQALQELFEKHGYQTGDLAVPRPGDSFFFFKYDWRYDNVRAARLLREQLDRLRVARGEDRLRVRLVCQSNGGQVCRYLLKYGGASLARAEAGLASSPAGIQVDRLVLVGTANGGSLRPLLSLNRGRKYIGAVGRMWQPETVFTFRSVFQSLPAWPGPHFVDEQGRDLDVDLYDADVWERYQWSVYGPESARRLARRNREDLFGTAEERQVYLRGMLDESKRFQALLSRDVPGFGETRYYSIQNIYRPTPRKAVLARENGRWKTSFTDDPWLKSRPHLEAQISSPGDGHGTRESQLWLSPQERRALVEPFPLNGRHGEIVFEPAAQRQLLEVLKR